MLNIGNGPTASIHLHVSHPLMDTPSKRLVPVCSVFPTRRVFLPPSSSRLLAPLVGGTCEGRGERSMSSLAKLARAIASGRVRQHCEQREYRVQVGVRQTCCDWSRSCFPSSAFLCFSSFSGRCSCLPSPAPGSSFKRFHPASCCTKPSSFCSMISPLLCSHVSAIPLSQSALQSLQQHVARLEAALQCGVQGLPGTPHASLGSAVALSAANATLQVGLKLRATRLICWQLTLPLAIC